VERWIERILLQRLDFAAESSMIHHVLRELLEKTLCTNWALEREEVCYWLSIDSSSFALTWTELHHNADTASKKSSEADGSLRDMELRIYVVLATSHSYSSTVLKTKVRT